MQSLIAAIGTIVVIIYIVQAYMALNAPKPKPRIKRLPGGKTKIVPCTCGRCSSCIQDKYGCDEDTAIRMSRRGHG